MAYNDLITRLLLETGMFDRNINKATKEVQQFQLMSQKVGSSFSSGLGVLSKYAPQLAAAAGGVAAFNATINSSEGLIDSWGRTCRVANTTVESFFTSITTGNFTNFLNGLESIIKSARDAYNEIDNLGTMIAFQDTEIAKIESRRIDLEYRIKLGKSKGEDVSALQNELLGTNEEIASLMQERADQATKAWKAAVKESVQKQTGGWYDEEIASKYSNWADFKTLSKAGLDAEERDIEKRKEALGNTYDYALVNLKDYQKLQAEGRLKEKGQAALQLINDERVYKTKRAILDQESKITEANKYQVTASQALAKAANARKESLRYIEETSKKNNTSTSGIGKVLIGNKNSSFAENGSLADLQRQLTYWKTEFANAGDLAGQSFADNMVKAIERRIKSMQSPFNAMESLRLLAEKNMSKLPTPIKETKKESEDATESLTGLGNIVATLGNTFSQTGDKGSAAFFNIMSSIIPAIGAIMALTVAEGEEKAVRSSKNWIEAISACITVAAAIAATFLNYKNVGKYANGGIVGGNSTHGDRLVANVNSGEMILNHSQQANLFRLLNNGSFGTTNNSGQVEFKLKGQELIGLIKNTQTKTSKLL